MSSKDTVSNIGQVKGMAAQALQAKLEAMSKTTNETLELEKCRDSFPYFLFQYARTRDEHDTSVFSKPFPRHRYVLVLAHLLPVTPRIAIEKSRQLMASWICCAFCLWKAMFTPNFLGFLQSKKAKDAADRLSRIYEIYYRLPEWMRHRFPLNLASGRPHNPLHAELHFTWALADADLFGVTDDSLPELVKSKSKRSELIAIPQGGDILRQFTASLIFSDEAAFQDEASASYTAAAPTLSPDSHFILVSSANPGFFEAVCKDRELR
jgi:hypothetical protein